MPHPLENKIKQKTASIGIIGLGFVGLSLLDALGRAGFPLLGYDRNAHKIEKLQKGKSYISCLDCTELYERISKKQCRVDSDPSLLAEADIFIIAVPTSLDSHKAPDLSKIKSAAHTIAKYLKQGSLVIVQSTSFPGTTEEIILPILQESHLKAGQDFHLVFIPEISDFGTFNLTFKEIPKVIGGLTKTCFDLAKLLYQNITSEVVYCSSPKVAEAAKILQNAYRLVNISLINEMKILFDRMHIDIWEVIDAAAKKPFGFTPFYPGPGIGGDCIPVDPYYLIWKAKETDGPISLIELAGNINDSIPHFVIEKIIAALALDKKTLSDANILILGASFKKDINDIRESCSLKILSLLQQLGTNLSYHDPYIPMIVPSARYPHLHMQSILLDYKTLSQYDCVVILTDHSCYDWKAIGVNSKRIVDTHNVTNSIKEAKGKVVKA